MMVMMVMMMMATTTTATTHPTRTNTSKVSAPAITTKLPAALPTPEDQPLHRVNQIRTINMLNPLKSRPLTTVNPRARRNGSNHQLRRRRWLNSCPRRAHHPPKAIAPFLQATCNMEAVMVQVSLVDRNLVIMAKPLSFHKTVTQAPAARPTKTVITLWPFKAKCMGAGNFAEKLFLLRANRLVIV